MLKFKDATTQCDFFSNRRALRGEKVFLDDDLTPAYVAHWKECMPCVLVACQEEKCVVYRDG